MKQNWNRMTPEHKRMAYFISYGNWDAREGFENNLVKDHKPEDLPFEKPARLAKGPNDIVKELPLRDLWQVSEKRREDYKKMTRRLDPVSKVVVYLAVIISMLAVYRDKTVGESEMIVGDVPDSPLMLADLKRQQEYEAAELKKKQEDEEAKKKSKAKKWYYLWLK